jgi:hypothetical protein
MYANDISALRRLVFKWSTLDTQFARVLLCLDYLLGRSLHLRDGPRAEILVATGLLRDYTERMERILKKRIQVTDPVLQELLLIRKNLLTYRFEIPDDAYLRRWTEDRKGPQPTWTSISKELVEKIVLDVIEDRLARRMASFSKKCISSPELSSLPPVDQDQYLTHWCYERIPLYAAALRVLSLVR